MTTETESDVKYINGIDEVIRLYRNCNRALETPNLIDKVCELAGKTSPEIWNYIFPIVKERTFIHNDSEMRVTFMIGDKPRRNGDKDAVLATIDMSFEDYEALPSIRYGNEILTTCLLYTSPSPRDKRQSRMPSSA